MKQKTILIILGNLAVISVLAITAVVMLKDTSKKPTNNIANTAAKTNSSTLAVQKAQQAEQAKAAAKQELATTVDAQSTEIDKMINSIDTNTAFPTLSEKDFQQ